MSNEPIWYTKKNKGEYLKRIRLHDRMFCTNCNRPIALPSKLLCSSCSFQLKTKGLEHKIIRFGIVGNNTIPYQQYLHRSFFNCNAPVAYRGNKEDRLKAVCKKKTISIATYKLSRLILDLENQHSDLFAEVHLLKNNIPERIVYNLLLHYILYYIEEKEFMSEAHFMATVTRSLHIQIERLAIRLLPDEGKLKYTRSIRQGYSFRYYKELIEVIDEIIEPLLMEVSNSILNK